MKSLRKAFHTIGNFIDILSKVIWFIIAIPLFLLVAIPAFYGAYGTSTGDIVYGVFGALIIALLFAGIPGSIYKKPPRNKN